MLWSVLAITLLVAIALYMRFKPREEEEGGRDTGLAILEFGKAYPQEAIREVLATASGDVVFARLHDGKVGFMQRHGNHYHSQVIEPGAASVKSAPSGTGLTLEFLDQKSAEVTFEFSTTQDAAEVSLWLLGSLIPSPDGNPEGQTLPEQ